MAFKNGQVVLEIMSVRGAEMGVRGRERSKWMGWAQKWVERAYKIVFAFGGNLEEENM